MEREVRNGNIPGAVVLIGNKDKVIYRKAFGFRDLVGEKSPMTEDTVFDLASLTKVVATTTAVMQLVEKGKLRLDAPVAKYWPRFKAGGKKAITVRQLLTHHSGLRPDLSLKQKWSGYDATLKKIIAERPVCSPGTRYIYSDINFEVLGELVRRVSGSSLDVYAEEHIFRPLGMNDTGFRPSAALNGRIAPTECLIPLNGDEVKILKGEVHDPTAHRMGGVAGHAGLFSTADDLSVFARMLAGGGVYEGVRILSQSSVREMTKKQTPADGALRGFGWDIYSPSISKAGIRLPNGFYGHTGYTGTSLWVDSASGTFVIVLTNRVHPDGRGHAKPLRSDISSLIMAAMEPQEAKVPGNIAIEDEGGAKTYGMDGPERGRLRTGIDVLESGKFAPLAGLKVGLITNHSGIASDGRNTLELLYGAQEVKLSAIFSPEHGISGKLDSKVPSTTYGATGLPIYSLYGDVNRPTEKMLDGLDVLVFDIQDVGVRFYTYITTMAYAMEAAARKGIPFYVLDRPNPLNASLVQGPVLDGDMKSFTGYFPMPVRYGMTVGELAEMFNAEKKVGAELHVIKMQGYDRSSLYDETGLKWVNPSPNIRSLTQAILYPGVALAEGANVSVGRGTETPFELLGAPWINSKKLAAYLNKRRIDGVSFKPVSFTPRSDNFKNKLCRGVKIVLNNRRVLDPAAMGIEIVSALYRLFPERFQVDKTMGIIGSRKVFAAVKEGKDPRMIAIQWQEPIERFRALRSKYLLY